MNIEAEQAVLGSLLMDPGAVVRVASELDAADFARPGHAQIYSAIIDLFRRQEAVDVLTVVSELERAKRLDEAGGAAYITELIEHTPLAMHVEYYAGLVVRSAIRRRLISAGQSIMKIANQDPYDTIEETVDQCEAELFGVMGEHRHRDLVPLADLLDAYHEKVEEIQESREIDIGIQTGFVDLDKLLGGLHPSDLCIIAGRPGTGKTSWLTSVATYVALSEGATIALFSLEMSGEQVVQRLLSSETGIEARRLRVGDIRRDELELVFRAIGRLSQAPIYIDDTPGISPFEIRTKVRRLHAEHGVDLVMVDYLQLMRGGRRSENRVQEISLISRSLKGLAREVGAPVIAASQLSRAIEARSDKRPVLSDLRESGSIEQDADQVVFISRKQADDDAALGNLAEVFVAKNRHGPTDKIDLLFIPHEARFVSAATDPNDSYEGPYR